MRKKLLGFIHFRFGVFICIAILFPLLTAGTSSGTIARVVNGGSGILGASSLTLNFTITGSNLILFVSTFKQNSETITGVTWNGVPLTQVESVISFTTNNVQLWYLLAPAVGTHDLITTASGSSGYIITDYTLYSGVKQTGQLDGSTRVTGSTSITATITTGADDTWAFLTAVQGGSAGTNATLIAAGDKPTYDNQGYGTIAPGTAFSMTVNLQLGYTGGVIMATFKDSTTVNLCKAKSITASHNKLTLGKGKNGDVTITVTGESDCPVEGVAVTATINGKGKRLIDVSPGSQETDANGQAVFAISAKDKKGTAVLKFKASGLDEVATVQVKVR